MEGYASGHTSTTKLLCACKIQLAAGEARAAALQREIDELAFGKKYAVAGWDAEHDRRVDAEAAIVSLQAERDESIALLHGNPPIPDELTLPEKIASVINSRDRLQATNDLLDDLLQHDRGQLTALQAQLQAITQEMREKSDELFAREEMAQWLIVGNEEVRTLRAVAERLETLVKSQNA